MHSCGEPERPQRGPQGSSEPPEIPKVLAPIDDMHVLAISSHYIPMPICARLFSPLLDGCGQLRFCHAALPPGPPAMYPLTTPISACLFSPLLDGCFQLRLRHAALPSRQLLLQRLHLGLLLLHLHAQQGSLCLLQPWGPCMLPSAAPASL